MSNNYLNQQNGYHPVESNDANHMDNLLQDPFQQQQMHQQFAQSQRPPFEQSPSYSTIPQQPPEYSPLPPMHSEYSPLSQNQQPQWQQWPAAQSWPSPSLFGNAMQLMRRWSGKIAVPAEPVNQEPLVLYHPQNGGASLADARLPHSQRWKRSRAVRISMLMRHRRERWKRSRPSATKIWSRVALAFCLMLVLIICAGTFSAYAYYESQLPALQGLANRQIDQTTRIYDRNGQLLFEAYDNNEGRRTPVDYKYIPGVMQDAMIAAEDHLLE
jgi:hypothetical protein